MTHWFHVLATFPTQCLNAFSQDADGYCPLFCWHLSIINKRSKSPSRLATFLLGKEGTEIDTHNAKGWEALELHGGWGSMEQLPETSRWKASVWRNGLATVARRIGTWGKIEILWILDTQVAVGLSWSKGGTACSMQARFKDLTTISGVALVAGRAVQDN